MPTYVVFDFNLYYGITGLVWAGSNYAYAQTLTAQRNTARQARKNIHALIDYQELEETMTCLEQSWRDDLYAALFRNPLDFSVHDETRIKEFGED